MEDDEFDESNLEGRASPDMEDELSYSDTESSSEEEGEGSSTEIEEGSEEDEEEADGEEGGAGAEPGPLAPGYQVRMTRCKIDAGDTVLILRVPRLLEIPLRRLLLGVWLRMLR